METKLTIDQAAELVKNSVGDVFSRDAVLSILNNIKVPEMSCMEAVRTMIYDHKALIRDESFSLIENNFDQLVDYDDVEFRLDGHNELFLDSVGMSGNNRLFIDLSENIVSMLMDGLDEICQFETMENELNEMSNINSQSDEQSNA